MWRRVTFMWTLSGFMWTLTTWKRPRLSLQWCRADVWWLRVSGVGAWVNFQRTLLTLNRARAGLRRAGSIPVSRFPPGVSGLWTVRPGIG